VDRQKELAGLSASIGEFCHRVRQGLDQASFEQRRSLVGFRQVSRHPSG
jgi:hypothetical protein